MTAIFENMTEQSKYIRVRGENGCTEIPGRDEGTGGWNDSLVVYVRPSVCPAWGVAPWPLEEIGSDTYNWSFHEVL